MRVGFTRWWVAWLLVAVQSCLAVAKMTTLSISRQHQGDMFTTKDVPCSNEVCVGRSSGTAAVLPQSATSVCPCQCLQHLPVFRDDMQICVEDIHDQPGTIFSSPDLHLRHCDCPADFRPNKNKTEVFVDLHMSSRVLNLLYESRPNLITYSYLNGYFWVGVSRISGLHGYTYGSSSMHQN
ncbi:hypothetical protein J6590_043616 [Homalodisca vitripennis]|nr:hypothetical protein J6590_043616 [Homalodisca vitripennis]